MTPSKAGLKSNPMNTYPFGPSNHVHHKTSTFHYWEGEGPLSIKSFTDGTAYYEVGHGHHVVNDNCYFLLNHGQRYSITIDSHTKVESFCLFFRHGFVNEVLRCHTARSASLLEDPEGSEHTAVDFFERTYPNDTILSPFIRKFRIQHPLRREEPGWLDEQFHSLAQRLLCVHQGALKETESLTAIRASTRRELYRRVYQAQDYILAFLDRPLTLDQISSVACLSSNHLLRAFKQVFGKTPHQFLTSRRIERAQNLLKETDRSVTDVCMSVGFDSPSSFSWLFKHTTGLSPREYRKQKR